MGLSLNQIVRRIKGLALNHAQVRTFYRGAVTDFLTDKKTTYAGCFLQDSAGTIDPLSRQTTVNFRMFLLDLVNVSEEANENELDVQSDMLQVAQDLVAEMDSSVYDDWKIASAPFTLVREDTDDMVAGVVVDLSIIVMYTKDTCAVPHV